MKKEDLQNIDHYLKFKDLIKFVDKYRETLSEDAPVVTERVEDKYFINHGWQTYKNSSVLENTVDEFIPSWGIGKDANDVILIYNHY